MNNKKGQEGGASGSTIVAVLIGILVLIFSIMIFSGAFEGVFAWAKNLPVFGEKEVVVQGIERLRFDVGRSIVQYYSDDGRWKLFDGEITLNNKKIEYASAYNSFEELSQNIYGSLKGEKVEINSKKDYFLINSFFGKPHNMKLFDTIAELYVYDVSYVGETRETIFEKGYSLCPVQGFLGYTGICKDGKNTGVLIKGNSVEIMNSNIFKNRNTKRTLVVGKIEGDVILWLRDSGEKFYFDGSLFKESKYYLDLEGKSISESVVDSGSVSGDGKLIGYYLVSLDGKVRYYSSVRREGAINRIFWFAINLGNNEKSDFIDVRDNYGITGRDERLLSSEVFDLTEPLLKKPITFSYFASNLEEQKGVKLCVESYDGNKYLAIDIGQEVYSDECA